jgi:uncharacterized damage-inducible protein DinB
MSQIEFIVDQLNRAFDGEAWHGPALMEILDGVDAKTAAARPLPTAHSIWELVLHISVWEQVCIRRIRGESVSLSDTDEANFGRVEQVTEAAWQQAVQTLRQNHAELIQAVSALPESRLYDPLTDKDYNLLFMLNGAVQHAAYHGGQIALLKRAHA